MKARIAIIGVLFSLTISRAIQPIMAQDMAPEYQQVLKTVGKAGDYKSNVLKVNIPRNDIHVTIDNLAVPTPFGFGGWFAMTKDDTGDEAMMGDLVLLQEEVNPVMSALLGNGLEVTALHNHFFWENPRIYYMHIHGHGKATDLAEHIKPAVALIGKGQPSPPASSSAPTTSLDTANLAKIVGHNGEQNGAVYKIIIGRDELKLKETGA